MILFKANDVLGFLNEINPDFKPLPQHFITSQDQHTRELYATLLAAVLLSDGQVSKPQSRLFGMLLQSMQLEPVPAKFFELAQYLDAGKLKQLIQGLSHQDQQSALIIDMLILSRLDRPLGRANADLLAGILDGFCFSEKKLKALIFACDDILGLIHKNLNKKMRMSYGVFLSKKINPIIEAAWNKNCTYFFKNGILIDPVTGLMWMRGFFDQESEMKLTQDQPEEYDEHDAQEILFKINQEGTLFGFKDWRFPNTRELKSLSHITHSNIVGKINLDFIPSESIEEIVNNSETIHDKDGVAFLDLFEKPIQRIWGYHEMYNSFSVISWVSEKIRDFENFRVGSMNSNPTASLRLVRDMS